MPIFKIGAFNEFWYDGGYLFTCKFLIIFFDEHIDEHALILMKDEIVEYKMIYGLIDLCEESLYLFSCECEILMYHFFKVGSFLVVGMDIL